MFQDNKNLLIKNYHDWAIFSIINKTKLNDKPVIGWKLVAGKKITVKLYFYIVKKFREEVIIRGINQKEEKKLHALAIGENKLNFYLPNDLVLFQSRIKQIKKDGSITVDLPNMLAQIDRRKKLRLPLKDQHYLDLSFRTSNENENKKEQVQTFKKRCFDISSGGISFIISKTEQSFFKEEKVIEKFSLLFSNSCIVSKLKIIEIIEIHPDKNNDLIYKGFKVSGKFLDLNSSDEDLIDDFVFKNLDFDCVI